MSTDRTRVGITTRVVQVATYNEPRDALAQSWAPFLQRVLPDAGWMMLPNLGAPSILEYCRGWGINRLILSGGEDMGVNPVRDETESALLDWAESDEIPLLGICRGMQLMCQRDGVGLQAVAGHVGTKHQLQGALAGSVNSFHCYAPERCPPDYEVLALAENGEIEAIRHRRLAWEGWMWHPEREDRAMLRDIERLRDLFK